MTDHTTIFIGSNCAPCQQVKDLVAKGHVQGKVELVDIETDAGFERFVRDVLEHGDGAVPSAYRDGRRCAILVDDEQDLLTIDCDAPIPPDPAPDDVPSAL